MLKKEIDRDIFIKFNLVKSGILLKKERLYFTILKRVKEMLDKI